LKISENELRRKTIGSLSMLLNVVQSRTISPEEIKCVILSGEIIEDYPKDKYGPSCLIYGITEEGRILHVQCSSDPVWIITAYDPTLNPEEWDKDFKRRRAKS